MTRIAIDLNVRVHGNQTFAGFEDVDGDLPHEGDYVEVYERESGVFGKGQVARIDTDRKLIYLLVSWHDLAEPVPGGGVLLGSIPTSIGGTSVAIATPQVPMPPKALSVRVSSPARN